MNIQAMMQQAKQMQERLQQQMAGMRVEATAGGGMVTVVISGTKQLESIKIDPEVVSKDDVEMLQDLIVAAFNDAARKVDEQLGQQMSGLMGGLKIPGLSNAWTMPIKGRIDMLTTGVRTPVGIKIYGSDIHEIERIGTRIESVLPSVFGTRSAFAERAADWIDKAIEQAQQLLARWRSR